MGARQQRLKVGRLGNRKWSGVYADNQRTGLTYKKDDLMLDVYDVVAGLEDLAHEKGVLLTGESDHDRGIQYEIEVLQEAIKIIYLHGERERKRKDFLNIVDEAADSLVIAPKDKQESCEQYCNDCPHRVCGNTEKIIE